MFIQESAKGQMINALQLILTSTTSYQKPTDQRRPRATKVYHLMNLTGTVEEAKASYIIRDFETDAFENRKAAMQAIADKWTKSHERINLTLKDQYYNMKQVIEKDMTPITIAKAYGKSWHWPINISIRGGTDGSKFPFAHPD